MTSSRLQAIQQSVRQFFYVYDDFGALAVHKALTKTSLTLCSLYDVLILELCWFA